MIALLRVLLVRPIALKTIYQFYDFDTEPYLFRFTRSFHLAFATGVATWVWHACRERLFLPLLGLAYVLVVKTNVSKTCRGFPDFSTSNFHRYFPDFTLSTVRTERTAKSLHTRT